MRMILLAFLIAMAVVLPSFAAPTPEQLARLIAAADAQLEIAPVSVMDKEVLPASGDRHDYYSIAIYWWANPDTADGLPWVRRDGERNPAVDNYRDKPNMRTMQRAVEACAVAYHYTGDERYAEHASAHLTSWFLDPETRMNPHLRYAQAIPGITEGRRWGIIDTAQLGRICSAAELLVGSRHWPAGAHEGLKRWFHDYLDWLRESSAGQGADGAHNNHGTWYDVQVVQYAMFVGEEDYARQVLGRVTGKRVASQIQPDGRQPHELGRTKSWSYSIYNLNAFMILALEARHLGIELLEEETGRGASLKAAADYLKPYAMSPETWPHQQIRDMTGREFWMIAYAMGVLKPDAEYLELAYKLNPDLEYELLTNPLMIRYGLAAL
jgi:hypothetical protein